MRRYFTTNKAGEEVEVDREFAVKLIDAGKKTLADFEFEDDEDELIGTSSLSPQVPTGTPLEQAGRQFEQEVAPHQQLVLGEKMAVIDERQKRREMAEVDPATGKALPGEGLTAWEKAQDIAFTPEVVDDPYAGLFTKALAGLGLTTRATGAAVGQGEITDQKTKALKPLATKLDKWAETREARDMSAKEMIPKLEEAVRKSILSGKIPKENIQKMVDTIGTLKEQESSGALTTAINAVDNVLIDIGSDPAAWGTILKGVFSVGAGTARAVAREGAKDIISSGVARKLAIKKGLGIPNDEMLNEISKIPGKTIKDKLRHLRVNKYDQNALQTSGRFKPSAIEEAIGDVDHTALQKQLDELGTTFKSEVGATEAASKGREEAISRGLKEDVEFAKGEFGEKASKMIAGEEASLAAKEAKLKAKGTTLSQKAKKRGEIEETFKKGEVVDEQEILRMEQEEAIKGVDAKLTGEGVSTEEAISKVTGEGEFSGVGKNVGFNEMEELSKAVDVGDKGKKGLLKHMAEVATGGKSEGVNYDAIAEELFKVKSTASEGDLRKALKAIEKKYEIKIPKEMSAVYENILKGDVNSLRNIKKDLNAVLAKGGEITSGQKVRAQGFKDHIENISKKATPEDTWDKILSSKELGGDIGESISTFRQAAGIGSSGDATIIGKIAKPEAISKMDKWIDVAAKEFVENNLKFPSGTKAKLLQWKKHLNIDIISEVRKRAKPLEKGRIAAIKSSASTDIAAAGKEAIKDIGAKSTEAAKKIKARTVREVSREGAKSRNVVRNIKRSLVPKRNEVIEAIKGKAKDALERSKIAKSNTLDELQQTYDKASKSLTKEIDALKAKGIDPTGDFQKEVDRFASEGSFQLDSRSMKNFRDKYGDKLADMIPDAGIMAILDVSPKGKVLRNDELFSMFKGLRVAPSATAKAGAFGEGVINKAYSMVRPYEARLQRALNRIKKTDVLTAKRMNRAYKKGRVSDKELAQFKSAMNNNPLVTMDMLSQEFKFINPLTVFDKAFLTSVAKSTGNEYTAKQRSAAKRMLARSGK